jgi:hypothetical protein
MSVSVDEAMVKENVMQCQVKDKQHKESTELN